MEYAIEIKQNHGALSPLSAVKQSLRELQ